MKVFELFMAQTVNLIMTFLVLIVLRVSGLIYAANLIFLEVFIMKIYDK